MSWWQRLMRRKQMEEQLDRELRFHLDQHAADLAARGLSADQARRQARLALGGEEQVKELCRDARGTRWLEDLWQDTRYALRTLRQRPSFAAVAILTLALGIGATTVMFTVINSVLLKPLAYPHSERLVALHVQTEKLGDTWGFSYPDFLDCRRDNRTLALLGAWTYGGGTVSQPGEPEYVDGRDISSELFSVLEVPLLKGRAFLPQEDQPAGRRVIIISYGFWQRRFGGNPEAIGTSLVFEGKSYTIVGIAPAGFQLEGEVDVLTPLGQNTEVRTENRAARFIHLLGRLRPNVTLTEAQAEFAVLSSRLAKQYPRSNANLGMTARPLRQELVGDVRPTLWMLLGSVGILLLIACVNVASLLLARAVSRQRELAMRVALGAGRARLVRQCLTESAVLGLSGGVLGLVLAVLATHRFVALWPGSLPRADEVRLDWRVLVFALAVSLATGLLFGLAPALRAPHRELEHALRAAARTVSGGSRRLHSAFIISEIALAVVLLVSAGLLGRSLLRLSSLDPGLNVGNVLTAHVALSPSALATPTQARAAWQNFLERARRVPGVHSVALADIIPMRTGENVLGYSTTVVPPPANQASLALASTVTPDYLRVMGIKLLHGRFFTNEDRLGGPAVVVIDENLARHAFGRTDVVGKQLWSRALGPAPFRVIGVVGHVRHWGLADDEQSRVQDQLYYPFAQVPDHLLSLFSSFMSVAVRTDVAPLSVVEPLRREERGVAGDQTLYEVRTMQQLVSASLARQRFLLLLFGVFAGLALALACIGIYGVLSYLTSQRVPEMGVRMALGANAAEVLRLVLRQSLAMIFAGICAGALGAFAASRIMLWLVPGIRPLEPATLLVMTSVLLIAALSASFLPARRASRVDPMNVLRQE
ncbi:MAG TPA: ABC transporter permease [Bryobacteraceae bacterium]|nr:ABC transporter permease [Bryobacteraceae bacterium]